MSRGDRILTLAAGVVLLIVLGFVGLNILVGWAYSSMTPTEEEKRSWAAGVDSATEIAESASTNENRAEVGVAGERYEGGGDPIVEFRVFCLSGSRRPIPGAQVTVRIYDRHWGTPWLQRGREPSVRRTLASNAKGESFFHLPAMETHAILFVDAKSEGYSIRSEHRVLRAGETPKGRMDLNGMVRDFRIEGRVLDEEGHALAGAEVYCSTNVGHLTVLSDKVGKFVLFAPRLGSLHVRASARGRIRQWRTIPTPNDEEAATCVFRLGKGRSVHGVVVDGEGHAVLDAMVTIRTKRSQESERTNSEGRFVVEHLDPAQALHGISISHTDFLNTKLDLAPESGEDLGVFRMERGMSLRGRVLDPTGRAVQGALVFLTHSLDRLDRITDDQGLFSYKGGIPKGPVALLAKAPGFGAGTLRLQATASKGDLGDIDLQLGTDHSIRGQIRDRKGHPLAGVHVSAYRLQDKWGFQLDRVAISDTRGRYEIRGLPMEKLRVYTHGAPLWRDSALESRVDVQHVDFVLDPILALRLRVLDAETGKPIPHMQVTAWIPEQAVVRVPFWWLKDPKRPGQRGWSRPHAPESGEILVRIPELRAEQQLTLAIEAQGYERTTVQSLLASTHPKLQTVRLQK